MVEMMTARFDLFVVAAFAPAEHSEQLGGEGDLQRRRLHPKDDVRVRGKLCFPQRRDLRHKKNFLTYWYHFQLYSLWLTASKEKMLFLIIITHKHQINFWILFHLGSLSSPMSTHPLQSYHLRSTYFHQYCQWFFDPPPARKLSLKIASEHETGS